MISEHADELFFAEVIGELSEARRMFPKPHATFVALVEEVGELGQALMEVSHGGINKKTGKPFTSAEVVQEAVQVATMAARVAIEGDLTLPGYKWPYE